MFRAYRILLQIRTFILIFATLFTGSATAADAAEFYERALRYYHDADLKSAVIETKNALKEDSAHIGALILLGKLYLATGNGAAAESSLKTARESGARDEEVLVPLAESYIMQRRFEPIYDTIIPLTSKQHVRAQVHSVYGVAMFEQGRLRAAEAEFDIALRLDSRLASAQTGKAALRIREGKLDAARRLLERVTTTSPNFAKAWYLLARLQIVTGQRDAATASLNSALASQPFYSVARTASAELMLATKQDERAREDIEFVLDIRPLDPFANYLRASLQARAGDAEAAQKSMDVVGRSLRALGSTYIYKHPESLFLWGVFNFRNGTHTEAKFALEAYTKHGRASGLLARKMLAILYLRKGEARSAIDILEPVVDDATTDEQALALLGKAHLQLRNAKEATAYLERAVALAPSEPDYHTQLAMARIADGRQNEAVQLLRNALDLDKQSLTAARIIGEFYLRHGKLNAALRWADEISKRGETSVFAHNLRGAALAGLGNLDDARKSFDAALALDPADSAAYYNIAELELKSGHLDTAKKRMRSLLEQDPQQVRALAQLGQWAKQAGDLETATTYFEKIRAVSPKALTNHLQLLELYLAQGKVDRARSIGRELAARHPDHLRALLGLGRTYLASGDHRAAATTFRRMSRVAGYDAAQLRRIARLQLQANDAEGARWSLQKVLQKQPKSTTAMEMLVGIEQRAGHWQKALERAQDLLQAAPRKSLGYEIVGELLMRAGEFDEALETYQSGMREAPSSKLAIGEFLAASELTDGKPQGQQARFETLAGWIKGNPDDVSAQLTLAGGYARAGETKRAQRLYEQLAQEHKKNARVLNSLAHLYTKLGDARAIETAERALKLAPAAAPVLDTYGWALVEAGQPEKALPYLREARLQAPRIAAVHYHLGVALHELGRSREARLELQEALSIDASMDGASRARALLEHLKSNQ